MCLGQFHVWTEKSFLSTESVHTGKNFSHWVNSKLYMLDNTCYENVNRIQADGILDAAK